LLFVLLPFFSPTDTILLLSDFEKVFLLKFAKNYQKPKVAAAASHFLGGEKKMLSEQRTGERAARSAIGA